MATKRVVANVDARLHKAALVASAVTEKTFQKVLEDALREWVNGCPAAKAILEEDREGRDVGDGQPCGR